MTYYLNMLVLGKLSTIDLVILITIPSAVVIGLVIFFFAGLHHPPKKYAIVIEKVKEFYCVYDKGYHFKMPIVYQRAGTYCIVPQTRTYTANNGNAIDITYRINDVKTFHYANISFDDLMKKIEKENSEINLTILTNTFAEYGLEFISIKKALN